MEVSFIIVNYNGEKDIGRCIDSIIGQNANFKFEIIVADNNSKDKSIEIIQKYRKVRLIKNKENYGFAKGNNIGIKLARGRFIALINNDVSLEKTWIEKMLKRMRQDEKIGVIGSKILYPSGKTWAGGGKIYFPGFARHLMLEREAYVDYVAFAAVVIRKEAIEKLDEKFFMYFEDTDLCRRIREKKHKILYYPGAIAYHHIKQDRISENEEYYIERNRSYYYAKNYNLAGKLSFLLLDIIIFFPAFSIYRIINNPKRINFMNKIIRARIDSIKLILGKNGQKN